MRVWICLALSLWFWGLEGGAQVVYRPRLASTGLVAAPDGNPSIQITSCQTSVSVSPVVVTGTAADNVSVTVSGVNDKGGACTTTNTGTASVTWSSSCVLTADDTNTLTFTASDGSAPHATAVCAVAYTTPDPTDPVVEITGPNGGSDIASTSLTSLPMVGTCADNVACVFVRCRTNGGSWVTDNSVSTGWSLTLPLAVGANTIECEAQDEQTNTHSDFMAATRVVDAGSPVVAITHVNGVAYSGPVTTSVNDLDLTGSYSDAGGITRVRVFPCDAAAYATFGSSAELATLVAPALPTSGTWTVLNKPMQLGTHTYCARAWDGDSQAGDATPVTVTLTQPTSMITYQWLPPGRQNVAYTAFDIYADGSDGVFTWDNGTSGLTIADADCAGLTLTEVTIGLFEVLRVSGTPTATGTCTIIARATGGDATSATWTANMTIGTTALRGAHDRYAAQILLPEFYASQSFRTPSILEGFGGGAINVPAVWSTTADYSELTMDAANFSGTGGEQVYVTFPSPAANPNTGWRAVDGENLTVIYDIWWDEGFRPYYCRGGGFNQFQEGYTQKAVRLLADRSVKAGGEETIFFEDQPGYMGASAVQACDRVGVFGERGYAEETRPGMLAGPNGKDSPHMPPCGGSLLPDATGRILRPRTWYTMTFHVEPGKSRADFAEWMACANLYHGTSYTTADLPDESYYRITAFLQGEFDVTPLRRIWMVPIHYYKNAGVYPVPTSAGDYDIMRAHRFEFNSSAHAGVMLGDMHIRLRNAVALKGYVFSDMVTPENDTTIFTGAPVR